MFLDGFRACMCCRLKGIKFWVELVVEFCVGDTILIFVISCLQLL